MNSQRLHQISSQATHTLKFDIEQKARERRLAKAHHVNQYSGTPLLWHLGDLAECPVYSGTTLLWAPWGPGGVSYIQWNHSIAGTLGTWWSVLYTAESLYCGHLGDLVECPVYSGITLLWAPRGPGGVSCIQRNHSIVGTLGTWRSVLYTVESLYCGHLGNLVKCPV